MSAAILRGIANVGAGTPDLIADVAYFRLGWPPEAVDPAAPVLVPGDTYLQWLALHLSPLQLADPALTDMPLDLDGDRLPNVLDFLIDDDPSAASTDTSPAIILYDDGIGGRLPRYRLARNPAARGWRLVEETSTNLLQWSTLVTVDDGATPVGRGFKGETSNAPPVMLIGPAVEPDEAPQRYYRPVATPLPKRPCDRGCARGFRRLRAVR